MPSTTPVDSAAAQASSGVCKIVALRNGAKCSEPHTYPVVESRCSRDKQVQLDSYESSTMTPRCAAAGEEL